MFFLMISKLQFLRENPYLFFGVSSCQAKSSELWSLDLIPRQLQVTSKRLNIDKESQ